jgi:hypothetical protein
VLVGQVRVVEQVTLEEKLCGFEHRPFKLYPIGIGAIGTQSSGPDDDITSLGCIMIANVSTDVVHWLCVKCSI